MSSTSSAGIPVMAVVLLIIFGPYTSAVPLTSRTGIISDFGFYLRTNLAFYTHPTLWNNAKSIGILPNFTLELCQQSCAVRHNCDVFLYFGGNQTCHQLQATTTGPHGEGIKITLPNSQSHGQNYILHPISHIAHNTLQQRNLAFFPEVPFAEECRALCSLFPEADSYLTHQAACYINQFIHSPIMLPVVGFKLPK